MWERMLPSRDLDSCSRSGFDLPCSCILQSRSHRPQGTPVLGAQCPAFKPWEGLGEGGELGIPGEKAVRREEGCQLTDVDEVLGFSGGFYDNTWLSLVSPAGGDRQDKRCPELFLYLQR